VIAAHDRIDEAAGRLVTDVTPTTLDGVIALLSYAADHVRDGCRWL
jgi:hypothetical protein